MKNFFETVANGVTKTVDYVVEKNRRAALINRVKMVIRSEEKNIDQAYIQLGKYYFHKLRDPQNPDTEHFCRAIDHSNLRIDRAVTKLEELTCEEEPVCSDCSCCGSECGECASCAEESSEETPSESHPQKDDAEFREEPCEEDLEDLRRLDGIEDPQTDGDAESAEEKNSTFPYDV